MMTPIFNSNLSLLEVFMILRNLTDEAYLVGGCVRDMFLNKEPKDFDIVTDVEMGKLQESFEHAGWSCDDTGSHFLVLNISKSGNRYEIANFRKDGVSTDGRRPDSVEIGTIEEDAKRRDFTVNSIYYNPWTGFVKDPTGKGLVDIRDRRLRFIGRPKDRIQEDYLRVFRYYRFLTKGFKSDPKSLRACREYFNQAYSLITPERVRVEIEKMVKPGRIEE